MTSKPETQELQQKEKSTKEESLSKRSSTKALPEFIVFRLYHKLTSKIHKKSQEFIDQGWERIDEVYRMIETSNQVTRDLAKMWCYDRTIYNFFNELWLANNLPHNPEQIISFGEFLKLYQNLAKDTTQKSIDLARVFYGQANEMWISMKDPKSEDLKLCCLLIVAQTIAKNYEIEDEGFISALIDLFTLIEDKKCVISNDEFNRQIYLKFEPKELREAQVRRAAVTFYTFAKRFVFLELPLGYTNQSLLRILIRFSQVKCNLLGEMLLLRIDHSLNVIMLRLGLKYQEKENSNGISTLLDRYHEIIEKILFVVNATYSNTKLAIEGSDTFQYLDKNIHFEDRYKDLVLLSQYISGTVWCAISPAYRTVNFTYNKVLRAYVVAIADVSVEVMKRSYATLRNKYAILKDATLHLRDNILEIRIGNKTFEELSADAKTELMLIYAEIKSLNYDKVKLYGSKAYQRALETLRGKTKAIEIGRQSSNSSRRVSTEDE